MVCYVTTSLKIVLSRTPGRHWAFMCGHGMDADLKEKVQGGELFTLVSHPAGEICPGPSHPIQEPAGTQ